MLPLKGQKLVKRQKMQSQNFRNQNCSVTFRTSIIKSYGMDGWIEGRGEGWMYGRMDGCMYGWNMVMDDDAEYDVGFFDNVNV